MINLLNFNDASNGNMRSLTFFPLDVLDVGGTAVGKPPKNGSLLRSLLAVVVVFGVVVEVVKSFEVATVVRGIV